MMILFCHAEVSASMIRFPPGFYWIILCATEGESRRNRTNMYKIIDFDMFSGPFLVYNIIESRSINLYFNTEDIAKMAG